MNIDKRSSNRLNSLRMNANGGIITIEEALQRAFEMGYRKRHYSDAESPRYIERPPFNPVPMVRYNLRGFTEIERVALQHVLSTSARGSRRKAAEKLGISASTLYRGLRGNDVEAI